jgi:hypothetical protein
MHHMNGECSYYIIINACLPVDATALGEPWPALQPVSTAPNPSSTTLLEVGFTENNVIH